MVSVYPFRNLFVRVVSKYYFQIQKTYTILFPLLKY